VKAALLTTRIHIHVLHTLLHTKLLLCDTFWRLLSSGHLLQLQEGQGQTIRHGSCVADLSVAKIGFEGVGVL
jgi:hypothetical protein